MPHTLLIFSCLILIDAMNSHYNWQTLQIQISWLLQFVLRFTAHSTQWGHVERGQFTSPYVHWASLVLQAVNQYCAHSFTRNWQLPFLNQWKGENDRRKYFIINLHERMLPTSVGVEPATSWSTVGRHIQLRHRGRQLIWICTVCKGRVYPGLAWQGLTLLTPTMIMATSMMLP